MANLRWPDSMNRPLRSGQSCIDIPWGRFDEYIANQPNPHLLTRLQPKGPLGTGETVKRWPNRAALEQAVWKHGQTCCYPDPALRPVVKEYRP